MNRLIANRGLLQIFFSLLLVIVIMFASNYIVYQNSISGIYDKVTQNNRMAVKNIIQSFDSHFMTVNNLIFAIHGLPYENVVSRENGEIDMVKVYMLKDSLSTLISSIDFIDDVIVFYDNADLAITSKGTSNLNVLFNQKYKHALQTADYWKSFARSKHTFTMFPADEYSVSSDGLSRRSRQLMVAMDGNKVRLSDKNVMIIIDVEKLQQQVNLKGLIPGASLIVLDSSRNVILSTEKDWDLIEVLNDVYFNTSTEASFTRENFDYHFYKSEYNDFIYIDKVPYQFQNIGSVTDASQLIMISAIISALLLSVLLSIYLYRPVKGILQLLGGGAIKGNDFRKIYSGIVKVQAENESLSKQMDFVDKEMRRGIFLQSLDELSHSQEYELQMQKYYPYFFQERYFVMVGLQLNRQVDGEPPNWRIEEITEWMQMELQNIFNHAVVFHSGHLQFLALVGMKEMTNRKKVLEGIESYVRHTAKHELQSFVISAFASKGYDSKISNMHAANQDIKHGMEYRNVKQTGAVVDTEMIRYVSDVYFPFEKIEKLSNCLLSGKTNESLKIVEDIVQENVNRNIHFHQMTHIAKSIFLYLLKQIGEATVSSKDLQQEARDFSGKVDMARHYDEIHEALIDAVHFIAEKRGSEQKSKLNAAFISQYIELHYMENLYLDHMAEVLDTSPKYFSNYFKKTFGINYVEYLNKVRLSHAREFLKNTDLSVAEIGEKTGYMNSSTFTTTFKKYNGISPSEYRKKETD
ncbi:helix-turn-helix transcriptional regulator [Paenibacillus sp. PL91]|uniref:helix-turn-helix transcriptional regulator n=1 Tax=Paenibacillus sp. PL91 TaxID=2729538 RepID=UPI00145C60FC|nr:AraC family transcriptional regulator [Paenibacillus sp. PL91]MBC9199462.1 helix-turn-helix transcriptional regulator [Paenibacillus sp. PL91]